MWLICENTKASGSQTTVLGGCERLEEFLLGLVLEVGDIYRIMKRILKEDVIFRLWTEREKFLIQEVTNGFGVFPDREVNLDRDAVAFVGNEVWLPGERVIAFWVSSENLRLQRGDGFVEVVEAHVPRRDPEVACPGEIVVRGSRPRDGEDVRVPILGFAHGSLLGCNHQLELFGSELDVIQARNSVLPIFRVLELDGSLQVGPVDQRRTQ